MKKLQNQKSSIFSFLKKIFVLIAIIAVIAAIGTVFFKKSFKMKSDSQPIVQSEEIKDENEAENEQNAAEEIQESPEKKASIKENNPLLKPLNTDFLLGKSDAPVVFIEYASLSCPHCASFTKEAFEKIKSDYIETGKVLFIYRDFPLNHPALAAAMLANCRASEETSKEAASEKFYSIIKILFRTQDNWAFDQKFIEKLEGIFKLDGMSSDAFKSCVSNKKLQEKILEQRVQTSKLLTLKSTPTFFVNGEEIDGYVDFKSIRDLIEKKLAEKASK